MGCFHMGVAVHEMVQVGPELCLSQDERGLECLEEKVLTVKRKG